MCPYVKIFRDLPVKPSKTFFCCSLMTRWLLSREASEILLFFVLHIQLTRLLSATKMLALCTVRPSQFFKPKIEKKGGKSLTFDNCRLVFSQLHTTTINYTQSCLTKYKNQAIRYSEFNLTLAVYFFHFNFRETITCPAFLRKANRSSWKWFYRMINPEHFMT